MRIDRYEVPSNIESVGQKTSGSPTTAAQVSTAASEDKTTLSSGSQQVATLTQVALQTYPSRADKVEALKQQINTAQYQLNSAVTAEAILGGNS